MVNTETQCGWGGLYSPRRCRAQRTGTSQYCEAHRQRAAEIGQRNRERSHARYEKRHQLYKEATERVADRRRLALTVIRDAITGALRELPEYHAFGHHVHPDQHPDCGTCSTTIPNLQEAGAIVDQLLAAV